MIQRTFFQTSLVLLAVLTPALGFRTRAKDAQSGRPYGPSGGAARPHKHSGGDKPSPAPDKNRKTYTCEDKTTYQVSPVVGEKNMWFKRMFEDAALEQLGVGKDVVPGRDPYTSLQFRAAWQVTGDNDLKRFNDAQKPAFNKAIGRFKEFLAQRPRERKKGSAMKQAANQLKRDVSDLNTSIQQMREYPKDLTHPSIPALNGAITYLLHGTHPLALEPIACSGLRPGKSGLFGAAVYLSDKTAKIDQYTADDCTKSGDEADCKYVIETLDFPPPVEEPNGGFDRSKPVHYCLVVLTSPFRIAQEYAIKNGQKGRKNERQLFWTPHKKDWIDYPFDFKEQSFRFPHPDRRPIFDKYQFVHAYSKVNHRNVTDEIHRKYPKWEWYPILDRMDEFYLKDPGFTKVEYIIAYQRE